MILTIGLVVEPFPLMKQFIVDWFRDNSRAVLGEAK